MKTEKRHNELMDEKARLIIRLNAQLAINDLDGARQTKAQLEQVRVAEIELRQKAKKS